MNNLSPDNIYGLTHLLSEKDFVKLRRMGYCAWLFNPTLGFLHHPNGTLRGYELTSFPLSINPPENPLIASIPLQISLLEDLFTVQHGVQSILKRIKNTREIHEKCKKCF